MTSGTAEHHARTAQKPLHHTLRILKNSPHGLLLGVGGIFLNTMEPFKKSGFKLIFGELRSLHPSSMKKRNRLLW